MQRPARYHRTDHDDNTQGFSHREGDAKSLVYWPSVEEAGVAPAAPIHQVVLTLAFAKSTGAHGSEIGRNRKTLTLDPVEMVIRWPSLPSPIGAPARGRIEDEAPAGPRARGPAGPRDGDPRSPLRRGAGRCPILSLAQEAETSRDELQVARFGCGQPHARGIAPGCFGPTTPTRGAQPCVLTRTASVALGGSKSNVHLRYSQLHAGAGTRFLASGVKELD